METLSFIVLILLSLVGYSGGAVAKAGKFVELKPQIIDLILVAIIWIGAIYSRVTFDLNKWLLILMWVILSIIIGIFAILFRNYLKKRAQLVRKLQEFQQIYLINYGKTGRTSQRGWETLKAG